MRKYIRYYTADGTLPEDIEEKNLYRLWAKKELSLAFPNYEIFISEEHSVPIFSSNEEDNIIRKRILQFCNNLISRWYVINKT